MKQMRLWMISIILLIMAGTPVLAAPADFDDVRSSDWFYGDVTFLVREGVVSGFGDGTYRPAEQVGVDAFIKMVVTALGIDPGNGTGYWASTYIDEAEALGILNRTWFNGIYARPITRGEMALLAAGAMKRIESLEPYRQFAFHLSDYKDIDPVQQEAVLINISKGIITGYADYSYRADRTATRAEAATIVSRIIDTQRRRYMNYFDDTRLMLANLEGELETKEQADYMPLDTAMEALLDKKLVMDSTEDFDIYRKSLEQNLFNILQNIALGTENGWEYLPKNGKDYYVRTNDPYEATIVITSDSVLYSEYNLAGNWRYTYQMDLNGGYSVLQAYDEVRNSSVQLSVKTSASSTSHSLQEAYGNLSTGLSVDYYEDHNYYYDSDLNVAMHVESNYLQVQAYDNDQGDGVCFIMFPDGADYVGKLTGYSYMGSGQLEYEDGTRFIGNFISLSLDGDGVLIYPNGTTLEGEFQDTFAISRYAEITGPGGTLGDFDHLLDSIIDETIKDFMNTNAKIKALHDYLVLHVEYAAETIQNQLSDLNYNNPYAALVDGQSVCLGYAQTLNLLLNRIGIESYVVIGDADKDGNDDHAWNYVLFDDGYYHVDATWDDPDAGNRVDSRFFKVSDAKMRTQRNISAIIGL